MIYKRFLQAAEPLQKVVISLSEQKRKKKNLARQYL